MAEDDELGLPIEPWHVPAMFTSNPEDEHMIETLAKEPERAKVVRGYPYRVATIRWREGSASADTTMMGGLWEWLSRSAGWSSRNNHSVFVFEFEGERRAVLFSDDLVRFGREEDVFERPL